MPYKPTMQFSYKPTNLSLISAEQFDQRVKFSTSVYNRSVSPGTQPLRLVQNTAL